VNAVHFEVHQHPKNKNTNQGHQDKLSKTRTTIEMTIRVMAAMRMTISWYKANRKQNPEQNLSAHSSNGEARGELPSQQKEVLMTFERNASKQAPETSPNRNNTSTESTKWKHP